MTELVAIKKAKIYKTGNKFKGRFLLSYPWVNSCEYQQWVHAAIAPGDEEILFTYLFVLFQVLFFSPISKLHGDIHLPQPRSGDCCSLQRITVGLIPVPNIWKLSTLTAYQRTSYSKEQRGHVHNENFVLRHSTNVGYLCSWTILWNYKETFSFKVWMLLSVL